MILTITAKCSDCCFTELAGVGEKDGYVPYGFMIGGGDYVNFSLDLETGKIVGFKPMTDEQAKDVFNDIV